MPWLVSLFGAIGAGLTGFFRTKQAAASATVTGITALVSVLKSSNAADAEIAKAVSAAVAAEAASESILARNWRPLAMILFLGMILAFFFGYSPPNINGEMPPMLSEIFDLVKIGLMGYVPLRSVEKIIGTLNQRKIIEQVIAAFAKK